MINSLPVLTATAISGSEPMSINFLKRYQVILPYFCGGNLFRYFNISQKEVHQKYSGCKKVESMDGQNYKVVHRPKKMHKTDITMTRHIGKVVFHSVASVPLCICLILPVLTNYMISQNNFYFV